MNQLDKQEAQNEQNRKHLNALYDATQKVIDDDSLEHVADLMDVFSRITAEKTVKLVEKEIENPYMRQVGGDHYNHKHDLAQFCIENNVCTGEFAVMKYAYRHRQKNGIEDLRKAKHWLEFLAYSVYEESL